MHWMQVAEEMKRIKHNMQGKGYYHSNQPDCFSIKLAKLFHIKFSTKKEEILVGYHFVHRNCLVIVHFEDYTLIAKVSTHQQNEPLEYPFEI